MKQTHFRISTLLLVTFLFLTNGFAQDYVHYKTLIGHTGFVYSVTFSSNGTTLATSSEDKTIKLWDVATGNLKKTLTGHTDIVHSVSFSPDGKTLASGSDDKTIGLWDAATGKHLRSLTGHTEPIHSISFSPDGQTLASGSDDHTIRLWDVDTGQHKKTFKLFLHSPDSISFSPDGQTLASGGKDAHFLLDYNKREVDSETRYTIHLWDVPTGKHLDKLIGHTSIIQSVAFSPNGKILASASYDKTTRLWKLTTDPSAKPDSPTPKPTANQIYNNAIRAVMWIVNPGLCEGSGVLIDKKSKLAVTNAHVTGKQNIIDVYFPAPDEKGELIKDRNFYLINGGVLKRLGYYTKGHVVAKNEKTDLAIIRLDGLPETAREIDWNLTSPATKAGELVYILGNPAKQELWRWTLGEFLNDHQDFLHIQSDVFGGNSGGPVLNKQGILLGIVARSDQLMNAAAIPIRHINRLLSESKVKHSRIRR